MGKTQNFEFKEKVLRYLFQQYPLGVILDKIYNDLNLRPFPKTALRSYLEDLYLEGRITRSNISGNRIVYKITEEGRKLESIREDDIQSLRAELGIPEYSAKKILFISYANVNLNKIKLIEKELLNHPIFEPLVVANNREPNKALVKKVTSGIKSAYRVIVILTTDSYKEQWINQEIGYASGKKIPIIPIIEESLLERDLLKGFIHKQNDCPYKFVVRSGLMMREENKLFMQAFRQLIKDLEEKVQDVR
jgi:hypothetical protein